MLEIITLNDSSGWDRIVKQFSDWDVYYLSGYVKGFKIHGDGEPLLIYINTLSAKAINVVMKRDVAGNECFKNEINKNEFFDFATPYGYGGFLIEGDDVDAVMREYEEYCMSNNIISEFVRFSPILKNVAKLKKHYEVIDIGPTVDIILTGFSDIWDNFTSQNRNKIRKAQKANVKIKNGNSDLLYDSFINIYNQTMKRDDAKKYYFFDSEFYKSIRNDLPENSLIFYAEYDNIIIASSIILFNESNAHYHLSGSLKEFQYLAPTNLLLYEAAKWAQSKSCRLMHLGGGLGGIKDDLFSFKSAFNKKIDKIFSIGKKIFNDEKYLQLVKIREKNNKQFSKDFFPLYRS